MTASASTSAPRRILIVAGTDTDVGKTVFAAALTRAIDGIYWKPVQAGTSTTDTDTVLRLSGLPAERVLPETYRLRMPAAPSIAAAAEGILLDRATLQRLPELPPEPTAHRPRPLVIEMAGGLLVPMAPGLVQIDLAPAWLAGGNGAVVLVARTALGTINHTLLSLEALRARGLAIAGVAFVGEPQPAAEAEIVRHGAVRRLGRLPRLARLDAATLAEAFAENFDAEEFAS